LSHSMRNTWRPSGAPFHLFHQKPLGESGDLVSYMSLFPPASLKIRGYFGLQCLHFSHFPGELVRFKLGNPSSCGTSNHTLELHPSQSTSEASLFVYLKLGGYHDTEFSVSGLSEFSMASIPLRGYAVRVKSTNCPSLAKCHPGPRL
jgi:hypothetical protein